MKRTAKGDLETLEAMLKEVAPAQVEFEMIVVQPGVKKQGIPEQLQTSLASANDFLVRAGYNPLVVWCS